MLREILSWLAKHLPRVLIMRSPKDPHDPSSLQELGKTTHGSQVLATGLPFEPVEDGPGGTQRQVGHFPMALSPLHLTDELSIALSQSSLLELPCILKTCGTLLTPICNLPNVQISCLTVYNNFQPSVKENPFHGPKRLFHSHFPCFIYKRSGYQN